ncbi:homoserine dehydrogenase [Clostridium oceanicum]|uniref:Homoserine dehydrogenase n=1 Tax=Clostridium oceanicum TaxID=1543 RepID=A0ABN1JB68_9CLOT
MISIAMLGYGVVGSGVAELINTNRGIFKNSMDQELSISSILVRNLEKYKDNKNNRLITNDIEDIFKNKVDIVVEAMGGLDPSYEYVKRSLKNKKHVVTANKDLIAEHGNELLSIARENGVKLYFEAAVGGGIPILKPLAECLLGNKIENIKAVLNGTTNFILSKIEKENMSYNEALKLAQDYGYAEANPESDVMGYDSARKLAILSSIAFNKKVHWKDMFIEGITDIDYKDFLVAKDKGYTIKLLCMSNKVNDDMYGSVRPVMVKKNSTLGIIENENNAILVKGNAVGEVSFCGKGAGMLPTASSVFADIVDVVTNKSSLFMNIADDEIKVDTLIEEEKEWLIRIKTDKRIDVMNKISDKFSNTYVYSNNFVNDESELMAIVKGKEKNINEILNEIVKKEEADSYRKILIMGEV